MDGFRSEGGVNNRHDWLELTIEWTPAVLSTVHAPYHNTREKSKLLT
jgi:hypothetical protein